MAVAVPLAVAAALQVFIALDAQLPLVTLTTKLVAGVPPVGETVIVFPLPAAVKVNHTSLLPAVSQLLNKPSSVAPCKLPVTQTLPDAGIITGVALVQLSLSGACAHKEVIKIKEAKSSKFFFISRTMLN